MKRMSDITTRLRETDICECDLSPEMKSFPGIQWNCALPQVAWSRKPFINIVLFVLFIRYTRHPGFLCFQVWRRRWRSRAHFLKYALLFFMSRYGLGVTIRLPMALISFPLRGSSILHQEWMCDIPLWLWQKEKKSYNWHVKKNERACTCVDKEKKYFLTEGKRR